MQTIRVVVSVEYRSDGRVDRGSVERAVAETLLGEDRAEIFRQQGEGVATWAGYRVELEQKPRRPA